MTRVRTLLLLCLMLVLNAPLLEAAPVIAVYSDGQLHKTFEISAPNALVLTISAEGQRIANLSWTGGNAGDTYTVERSDDNITWELLATTTATKYEDVIKEVCGIRTLYYRVRSGIEVSNSVSELLEDKTPPSDPLEVEVTINDGGYALLNWKASPSDDVVGYAIYLKEGNAYQPHAQVLDVTTFLDDGPNQKDPCAEVVTYAVFSIDQCGNTSPGNNLSSAELDIHNTILLNYETASLCGKKVKLTWNKYNNMIPAVSSYRVELNIVGQPTAIVGTISPESPLEFESDLLIPGEEYEFRVVATNEIIESRSCQWKYTPNYSASTLDIDFVTVTDDDHVTFSLTTDNAAEIDKVQIFRSEDGDEFKLLEEINWAAAGNTFTYNDNDAAVNEHTYTYHAISGDQCGNQLDVTEDLKTILLELTTRDNGTTAELQFNAIEDDVTYQLFRYENGIVSTGFPKQAYPPSEEDDASEILNSSNTYYFIEATYPDGTKVRSNTVQLPVKINVPNAFRPGYINPVFRPVLQNIEAPYLFTIYNNWGQLVFETNDPYQGWDGGDYPRGIYVYRITCKDQNGTSISQNGWVMMLK